MAVTSCILGNLFSTRGLPLWFASRSCQAQPRLLQLHLWVTPHQCLLQRPHLQTCLLNLWSYSQKPKSILPHQPLLQTNPRWVLPLLIPTWTTATSMDLVAPSLKIPWFLIGNTCLREIHSLSLIRIWWVVCFEGCPTWKMIIAKSCPFMVRACQTHLCLRCLNNMLRSPLDSTRQPFWFCFPCVKSALLWCVPFIVFYLLCRRLHNMDSLLRILVGFGGFLIIWTQCQWLRSSLRTHYPFTKQ